MSVSEYNKKAKAGNFVVAVAVLVCGIAFVLYRVGLLSKMVSLNDMATALGLVAVVLLFGLVIAYQWHINAQRRQLMDRDREISFVQSAMDLHSYAEQVEGLKKFADIGIIPEDPYDVHVTQAREMLGLRAA